MINKFQDKAQRMIAYSESIAFDLGQSNVGTEHLLLAYLKSKENKLKTLLEKEGLYYDDVKENIISLFGKKTSKPFFMEYTNSLKKVLEGAIIISKKKGEEKVSIDSLAISLIENNESVARELISKRVSSIQQIVDELKKQSKKSSELDNIFDLTNLNQKALKNQPILIHRENEINQLI